MCWKTASKNGCQEAAVVGAAAPVDLTGHGQHLTVLALPGRGMVQWLRVSYKATAALCTGHLVPVKELQVGLPGNGGVRTIPVSALPAVARTYCPEALPAVIETPEASLTGP